MTSAFEVVQQSTDLADWVTIQDLITRSCQLLDDEAFGEWLALFADEAKYEVISWSPELGSEQVWLRLSKPELAALLENVDNHIRDRAERGHIAALATIRPLPAGGKADSSYPEYEAVTRFVVLRTDEMGESALYLTGKYVDTVQLRRGQGPRLSSRQVRLDTRMFDVGSHLPV